MLPRVLFLCTGNSCRSQMAEGWARALLGDRVIAWSAGVETHGLNPKAVRVMAEAGVDIGQQKSQHIDEFLETPPDFIVTVCDHAAESCPVFPGATRVVHHAFRDPAKAEGTPEEVMATFREVRDEIRSFVEGLPLMLREHGIAVAGTLQKWDERSEEEVDEYGVFRIRRYLARSPRTGQKRPFAVADAPDWVNVIATTGDGDVVLVRQYRHGSQRVELEIPGGMVDAEEDPAAAAARELREETGYAGDAPVFLGTVEPNPAIFSNRCHTYLIGNARPVGELQQDPGEDIEVITLPRPEIHAAVANGTISHALVICAFWWLEHRGAASGDAERLPAGSTSPR